MTAPHLMVAALLAIVFVCAPFASAATFVIGRYAGEFLSLGAGARPLAMGGASVAEPLASSAVYYNPSALAGLQRQHVEFMHASQFDNLYTYDYLSFARPLRGGLSGGLTLLYTRVSDIPLTRLSDPSLPLSDDNRVLVREQTGDHEIAVMAGAGRMSRYGWRLGGSGKLLMKSVAGESAYGLGFDVAASRKVNSRLDFGLAARDISTSLLAWSTGRTEAILPSLLAGAAYHTDFRSANAHIVIAGDLDGHFESRGDADLISAGQLSVQPHVGVEYEIAHTVALRGGISGEDLTYGAGLRLSALSVSAAFQDHADLGFTHRISAAVTW
ncbi:hypothetical protein HZB60_08035 [candidate division KSB1 bacterium]|nr:hypothetical protein [candidate division KSB1 bacterium]